MTNKIIENIEVAKKFFTQKELAKRWNVSEGTVINWRKKGLLSFLKFPGSVRVLYPEHYILTIEQSFETINKSEVINKQIKADKGKKPVVSNKPEKEWRI